MVFENVEKFLQSQTFKDNVYAELMHRNLISDGYHWMMFYKPNYERNVITLSIYIAKQTKIEVDLEFGAFIEASSMPAGDYEFKQYIYRKVIKELDIYSFYQSDKKFHSSDAIDAVRYFYEITNNIKEEPIMTKKSMQEIEFDQFAANKEAELKIKTQEIQHEIDAQIEQKRLECQEDIKRQHQAEIAANYWYFYRGLIDAGFTEDQAMQILLNKMPAYVPSYDLNNITNPGVYRPGL